MSTVKDKSNNSLCEKSMKMVVNIIKLSSFSIAKMSLGVGPTEPSSLVTKNLAPVTGSVTDADEPLLPDQIPAETRKSSQQLRSRSKPFSFVMQQPDAGKGCRYVIHEGSSVIDGMASDYIRKFHEKNSCEIHMNDKSKVSPYRPSFPSRIVK